MLKEKIFYDEIPDALFRKMFRKNAVSFSLLFCITIISSLFFCFFVMQNKQSIKTYIYIKDKEVRIKSKQVEHQRLIRLLKSDLVRDQVVKSNHLIKTYKLDTNYKYYKIQLDKHLYDNMKIEEQNNETILVMFKNENINVTRQTISDLHKYALRALKNEFGNESLQIVTEKYQLDNGSNSWFKKAFSLIVLISSPVLLMFVLFMAIKEKILLNFKTSVR